jgi:hypothetical protein
MDDRDWIAGAAKALAIIEAFDEEHARMTPTMVAGRASLSRTAARRYLLTLRELGYVDTDGKLFWLAPRVLRLGQSYLDSARLPRTVQPFLQRITATLQETALVAILDEHDVVYVARNGVNRAMAVGFVLGSRAAAPLSSAGLVLLAFQAPEVIERWLAVARPARFGGGRDQRQHADRPGVGQCCLASGLADAAGNRQPVAQSGVGSGTDRLLPDDKPPSLRDTPRGKSPGAVAPCLLHHVVLIHSH